MAYGPTVCECCRARKLARVRSDEEGLRPSPAPPRFPFPRRPPPQPTAAGCTLVSPGAWVLATCTFDGDNRAASVTVYTDAACTQGAAVSAVKASEVCTLTAIGNAASVKVRCSSAPNSSAAGVIVGLAVTLALSTVGLCAFWVLKDKRARKALEAAGGSVTGYTAM